MNVDMMFIATCAACKHQRKKCEPNCQLAPYFPSTKDEDFQNVYRLFGVNNTIKHINSVANDQRAKLVETLILEAKIRKENPVHGCLAIERKLRAEIEALEKELEMERLAEPEVGLDCPKLNLCESIFYVTHQWPFPFRYFGRDSPLYYFL
ncbi:LOB domain-containing protein 24-like [Solanum tuberosum]|uniref:LOB domain-containing protein 24-like n=1 Tax=Solanum tuberosum TaxID=4113 RepID=UPI0003D25E16|nr:PREDICTED: LOB domain-containing protein 24-like [Solanum tuberosum]